MGFEPTSLLCYFYINIPQWKLTKIIADVKLLMYQTEI